MNGTLKDHLTLADISAHGMTEVEAACRACGHAWSAPVSILPASMSLAAVEKLMACPLCKSASIETNIPFGLTDRQFG